MLLKLKNACTLALSNLVEKAQSAGGVVTHIELSSAEAFDLLREININKDIRNHYSYDEDDTANHLGFRLGGKADSEEITKIANEWYTQKIGIKFDNFPLYIIVPPKPTIPVETTTPSTPVD